MNITNAAIDNYRTGMSVAALSRHLRVLRERGLVERLDVEGDGRGRQYQLTDDVLDSLSTWLAENRWSEALVAGVSNADTKKFLSRVGGFLDGFATSDSGFFDKHLSEDVELYFPGSAQPWGKTATVASVAGHAPYTEWDIARSSVRRLAPGLTIVSIEVTVRTTAAQEAHPVVQTMIFDDNTKPWTLRFLQQTPAT